MFDVHLDGSRVKSFASNCKYSVLSPPNDMWYLSLAFLHVESVGTFPAHDAQVYDYTSNILIYLIYQV